jgi:4-hydroxybenzoate polyprenyltransferase
MISLSHYLILAAILFAISIVGIFLNRKNLIVLLMAIELMLLAVNHQFRRLLALPQRPLGPACSYSSSWSWQPPSRASAWPSWWSCSATCPRSMSKTSTV